MKITDLKIKSLHYNDIRSATPVETIFELYEMITLDMESERDYDPPTHIIMDDGSIVTFNYYVLNSCYAKGRITEEEMIRTLRTHPEQNTEKQA